MISLIEIRHLRKMAERLYNSFSLDAAIQMMIDERNREGFAIQDRHVEKLARGVYSVLDDRANRIMARRAR